MSDTPEVMNIGIVDMESLQLSAYRALTEVGVKEAKHKAEAAEWVSRQEFYKSAIWSTKFSREQLALEIEKDAAQRHKQLKRPCMTLGAVVRPEERDDGTRFSCSWTGLVAYGETPEIACQNFDRMWVGGEDEL